MRRVCGWLVLAVYSGKGALLVRDPRGKAFSHCRIYVSRRFRIAAGIVYQLMSTTLAGRARCTLIEERAQSKEFRKVPLVPRE